MSNKPIAMGFGGCVPVSEIAVAQRRHVVIYTLRRWSSIRSSIRRTVWTHMAFWRFLYLVRDYGTLCLDCYTTQHYTSFGHSLKTFFSQSTSAYSGLGTLAIMRYTDLRFTYLLTYLHNSVCHVLMQNKRLSRCVCTCPVLSHEFDFCRHVSTVIYTTNIYVQL